MTSVDFYFNASDKLAVACRLAAKAHAAQHTVLILAPDARAAEQLDRLLWSHQALSFVPHCLASDALSNETPVLIATPEDPFIERALMINLAPHCPAKFERFTRLLELVSDEPNDRVLGRERYRFYKDRGYALTHLDLATRPTNNA